MELTTDITVVKASFKAEVSLRHLAVATAVLPENIVGVLIRITSLAYPVGFEGEKTGGSFFTDDLVELRKLGYITFGSGEIELIWQAQG